MLDTSAGLVLAWTQTAQDGGADMGKKNILLWFYWAYVAIYIARLNLSMASPAMLEQGVLTAVELGFIGSAFSLVYSCGRLFNGILGDRLAPKLLIVTGLLMAGLANLLLGLLPAYLLFLGLWCVNAFGQSMLWSAMLRSVSQLYGKAQADKKMPILVSSVSVGNILGILLGAQLVARLGLRAAFLVPGALTALTGMALQVILPPSGRDPAGSRFSLKPLLQEPSLRGILLPALFHGAIKENISLWMAVYLLDTFRVDLESSAWYVLLIPTVGLVGRLIYPACYRLAKNRENLLSLILFGLCALASLGLLAGPALPLAAAALLSLLYAFTSMINTSTLTMFPLRFANKGLVSSVSGVTDFATYLGTAIGSAIYGFWIADGSYWLMFASWAAISLLSILILLGQHPLRKEET